MLLLILGSHYGCIGEIGGIVRVFHMFRAAAFDNTRAFTHFSHPFFSHIDSYNIVFLIRLELVTVGSSSLLSLIQLHSIPSTGLPCGPLTTHLTKNY